MIGVGIHKRITYLLAFLKREEHNWLPQRDTALAALDHTEDQQRINALETLGPSLARVLHNDADFSIDEAPLHQVLLLMALMRQISGQVQCLHWHNVHFTIVDGELVATRARSDTS